jgi:hypothetical protein
MKTFTIYRRADISKTHGITKANPPNQPQFEGIIFSDGKVAIRWLTAKRSTSFFDSFDELLAVHGRPEYDSELVFHEIDTRTPEKAVKVSDLLQKPEDQRNAK